MNPFFRPHNVIPKQAKMQTMAKLLAKPQMAQDPTAPQMQPEEISLSAKKKRPLSGASAKGKDDSLPKGDASI